MRPVELVCEQHREPFVDIQLSGCGLNRGPVGLDRIFIPPVVLKALGQHREKLSIPGYRAQQHLKVQHGIAIPAELHRDFDCFSAYVGSVGVGSQHTFQQQQNAQLSAG